MSRTYRRRDGVEDYWITHELIRTNYGYSRAWVKRDQNTKEFKKDWAKYRSDAGTHNFKEPGPHWFRNLFTDRPGRRFDKRELQKFMADPDYEPMILSKYPLEYWT
jgi:hypothetical protein